MCKEDKYVGKQFKSNKCGYFEIVSLDHKRGYERYYKIRFLSTGYERVVAWSNILRGSVRDLVKDRNIPRVVGVGFVGDLDGSTGDKHIRPFYSRWVSMLHRIYNKDNTHYNSYGGNGVTIDESWLNFSTFYKDVQELEGFDIEKIMEGKLELDKDFKQLDTHNKVYSKDTCKWMTRAENSGMKMNMQFKFIAIDPSGNKYESINIRSFCKEHKLSHDTVSRVLRLNKETAPSVPGWKFYKAN